MSSKGRRALIFGITGQDGSYLAELLLENGYEVWGVIRRSSSFNTGRIDHIFEELQLVHGDMTDGARLAKILQVSRPDEVYNLAAQSHVAVSFANPVYTANVDGLGTLRLLEAIHALPASERPKLYQASSSEMFGDYCFEGSRRFEPRSPYACAKLFAHQMCDIYREAYGLFICCGILFNHESPRRGETFVTRKITRAVGRIKVGLQKALILGNLDAERDWGYAPDYVRAMVMMLQGESATDFEIGTGEAHSVREFAQLAFAHAGLDWEAYVAVDGAYRRPLEVAHLCADTNDCAALGWEPTVNFEELVRIMVDADMALAQAEAK